VSKYFFRDTITFLTSSEVIGKGGEKVQTFTTSFELKGSFQNVSGDWNIVNDLEAFRKTKMVYCQYSSLVNDRLRVQYAGKRFDIVEVSNIFNNHHLEISLRARSTE